MQLNKGNVRIIVYAAVAILLSVGGVVFLASFCSSSVEIPLLSFAATIISVATLASIAFAIVSYMESAILAKRIEDAKVQVAQQQVCALDELQSLRTMHFELARGAIKGMLTSFMHCPPGDAYRGTVKELQVALIDVNLCYGTYDALISAIQSAYKYDRKRFLLMETQIWEQSLAMRESDKYKARQYYTDLKEKMVKKLVVD